MSLFSLVLLIQLISLFGKLICACFLLLTGDLLSRLDLFDERNGDEVIMAQIWRDSDDPEQAVRVLDEIQQYGELVSGKLAIA